MILRKFFVLLLSLVNFQAKLVPNRTLAAWPNACNTSTQHLNLLANFVSNRTLKAWPNARNTLTQHLTILSDRVLRFCGGTGQTRNTKSVNLQFCSLFVARSRGSTCKYKQQINTYSSYDNIDKPILLSFQVFKGGNTSCGNTGQREEE